MTDSATPCSNLLHSLPIHFSSWSISRRVRITTQGYLGAGAILIHPALICSFPASPTIYASLSAPRFVPKSTFRNPQWISTLSPSCYFSLPLNQPLNTSRHVMFSVGLPQCQGSPVQLWHIVAPGSGARGAALGRKEEHPPLPALRKGEAATASPRSSDPFKRRSSSVESVSLILMGAPVSELRPLRSRHAGGDTPPAHFVTKARWLTAHRCPFPFGEASTPSPATRPSPTHLGCSGQRLPTQTGRCEEKATRVSLRAVMTKGAEPPALADSSRPRSPRGADSACFFPRRTPGGTPDLPHRCRPPQRSPSPRRLRPPSSPWPTSPPAVLPRRAVPPHRPRHGSPQHGTLLHGPRQLSARPGPAGPAGCPPAPSLQVRHTDRPTDRPTDGLSRLPAGCPAEPLPGGACPRRACWCCVAAEPWQERGARRWHAPAAGLGSVRPSLSPSRGGGPGSLQAPGTAGRLRWWPGPLTPPSSRPLEEASHGQRGFLPPLARRAAGRRAQMEGGQFPPSPHGWQRGAASRSSAPWEQGCGRRDAAAALDTPSAERGFEGAWVW